MHLYCTVFSVFVFTLSFKFFLHVCLHRYMEHWACNSVLHITVPAIMPLTAAGCFYYHNSLYMFELYSGIPLSCQKTFYFSIQVLTLRIARQWAVWGFNLPDTIEITSHALWDFSIVCARDVEYFKACVILRLFTGPGVLFQTLSCVFANGWRLKGNPLAEPTNLCLAHPSLLSLLCSFPLPALLNSAPGILDICWSHGLSLCLCHQQSSRFHMGYSCPVTWKFTSRHRWAGLTLSVLLLCGSYLHSASFYPMSWVRHALSHFLSCVWLRSSSCHSVTDSRGRLTLICIKQHPFSSLKSVLLLSSWVNDAFIFTHLLSLHTYSAYSCFNFQKTR